MRNQDELLEEAKWGKLTPEELAYVVQKIQSSKPGDDEDLYTWIHILGRSGNRQYRKLVEGFLYYPSNPIISRIALNTLCNYWSFARDYLKELKTFIKGVDWDEDQDVRDIAVSCAGAFLKEEEEKELLKLIIDIVEKFINAEEDSNDSITWENAYTALSRAMGKEWKDILSAKEIDLPMIEKAKQRLEN